MMLLHPRPSLEPVPLVVGVGPALGPDDKALVLLGRVQHHQWVDDNGRGILISIVVIIIIVLIIIVIIIVIVVIGIGGDLW